MPTPLTQRAAVGSRWRSTLGPIKKVVAILVCLAMAPLLSAAEPSVVLGRARSITYANAGPACPEDFICLEYWFRYVLTVDETLKGPSLSKELRAVHMQHTNFVEKYKKSLRLFVLRPIEDAGERAALQADYYLDDMSPVEEMYCLRGAPARIGLEASAAVVGEEEFCFSAGELKK